MARFVTEINKAGKVTHGWTRSLHCFQRRPQESTKGQERPKDLKKQGEPQAIHCVMRSPPACMQPLKHGILEQVKQDVGKISPEAAT